MQSRQAKAPSAFRRLTAVAWRATVQALIKSFRNKGLKELWQTGKTAGIRPDLRKRIENRLEVLDSAQVLSDLSGFGVHPLKGACPRRYSMEVNGPWRITFEFHDGDAWMVDLEQYH